VRCFFRSRRPGVLIGRAYPPTTTNDIVRHTAVDDFCQTMTRFGMPKAPRSDSPYWKLHRQMARLNKAVFRATGGRLGSTFRGSPVLLLDHVGRRTGQARTSPLIYLDDAPDLVVVASKGGTDDHPAWFHNLMAQDTAEVELPGGVRRLGQGTRVR
jgi:hypothetical protein